MLVVHQRHKHYARMELMEVKFKKKKVPLKWGEVMVQLAFIMTASTFYSFSLRPRTKRDNRGERKIQMIFLASYLKIMWGTYSTVVKTIGTSLEVQLRLMDQTFLFHGLVPKSIFKKLLFTRVMSLSTIGASL